MYQVDFAAMLTTKDQVYSQPVKTYIKKLNSTLTADSKFCHESDFLVRTYGINLYAFDSSKNNIHMMDINTKMWNHISYSKAGIK